MRANFIKNLYSQEYKSLNTQIFIFYMPEVVEVSPEVKKKLKMLSVVLDRPMKDLANEAILEYLKKFEKEGKI
jgi:hypothetical protein